MKHVYSQYLNYGDISCRKNGLNCTGFVIDPVAGAGAAGLLAKEGTNNKIKTMQRKAYGYRDMEFFKLKIMALHETKYALVG